MSRRHLLFYGLILFILADIILLLFYFQTKSNSLTSLLGIKSFKEEGGSFYILKKGETKLSEASPEGRGLNEIILPQGKVLEIPAFDNDKQRYFMKVSFPGKKKVVEAKLTFGIGEENRVLTLKASSGTIGVQQEWRALTINDLDTLLKKTDPVIVRIFYHDVSGEEMANPKCNSQCKSSLELIDAYYPGNLELVRRIKGLSDNNNPLEAGPVSALIIFAAK